MEIQLPKLTSYQQKVYDWLGDCKGTGKITVIKSVRQSGKSFFCCLKLIEISLTSVGVSAIFEPTLGQARIMYSLILKALRSTGLIESANSSTLIIKFTNGSEIYFRSTQQEDANRGLTVSNILILDECAYLDDETIYTILPLVNAHNAPIIIASTPFTMEGYFFEMFTLGNEESETIKTFDWSKDSEIERFLTPERKAFYKRTFSPQKYKTEVLGEFLVEGGLLFQNLNNCINGNPSSPTFAYLGIDFGTGSEGDFTVLSVINEKGEQWKLYRTNNLSPMQQVDWLAGLINEIEEQCTIAKVLAEQNSIGKVYIDALNLKIKTKLTNWNTTNKSKQDLVTTFQIALENENVSILNNDVLLNELRKYEAEINPKTKTVSYNGKNAHDDTVIATMLSYYALKSSFGNYNVSAHKPVRKKSLAEKYG